MGKYQKNFGTALKKYRQLKGWEVKFLDDVSSYSENGFAIKKATLIRARGALPGAIYDFIDAPPMGAGPSLDELKNVSEAYLNRPVFSQEFFYLPIPNGYGYLLINYKKTDDDYQTKAEVLYAIKHTMIEEPTGEPETPPTQEDEEEVDAGPTYDENGCLVGSEKYCATTNTCILLTADCPSPEPEAQYDDFGCEVTTEKFCETTQTCIPVASECPEPEPETPQPPPPEPEAVVIFKGQEFVKVKTTEYKATPYKKVKTTVWRGNPYRRFIIKGWRATNLATGHTNAVYVFWDKNGVLRVGAGSGTEQAINETQKLIYLHGFSRGLDHQNMGIPEHHIEGPARKRWFNYIEKHTEYVIPFYDNGGGLWFAWGNSEQNAKGNASVLATRVGISRGCFDKKVVNSPGKFYRFKGQSAMKPVGDNTHVEEVIGGGWTDNRRVNPDGTLGETLFKLQQVGIPWWVSGISKARVFVVPFIDSDNVVRIGEGNQTMSAESEAGKLAQRHGIKTGVFDPKKINVAVIDPTNPDVAHGYTDIQRTKDWWVSWIMPGSVIIAPFKNMKGEFRAGVGKDTAEAVAQAQSIVDMEGWGGAIFDTRTVNNMGYTNLSTIGQGTVMLPAGTNASGLGVNLGLTGTEMGPVERLRKRRDQRPKRVRDRSLCLGCGESMSMGPGDKYRAFELPPSSWQSGEATRGRGEPRDPESFANRPQDAKVGGQTVAGPGLGLCGRG